MEFVLVIMLFMIGSLMGWTIELLYRNTIVRKKGEKLKNPGFNKGPYLPLYGFGVLTLQFLSGLNIPFSLKIPLFTITLTILELITGLIFTKYFKVKLWDYSKKRFNYKGQICLEFTIYWTLLGIFYYFVFYERFVLALAKIVSSVDLTFYLGMIYGIFMIDIIESLNIAVYIKKYRNDRDKLLEKAQKYTRERIEKLSLPNLSNLEKKTKETIENIKQLKIRKK